MTLRAKNRKPTHPGAILREDVKRFTSKLVNMQVALDIWELERKNARIYKEVDRMAS